MQTILIIDRTQADVDNRTEKGHFNASDFNRISSACYELKSLMQQTGYSVEFDLTKVWTMKDYPTKTATQEWLDNVYKVINGYFAYKEWELPEDMSAFTWKQANNIEQALKDIEAISAVIRKNTIKAGRMSAGGSVIR